MMLVWGPGGIGSPMKNELDLRPVSYYIEGIGILPSPGAGFSL